MSAYTSVSNEDLAKLQAIASFAHRMLHVIDEAEVQADDSAVLEIPAHDWKELNDLLDAISDDPHEDMHELAGDWETSDTLPPSADEQPAGCKSPYCEPPWCKNCGHSAEVKS